MKKILIFVLCFAFVLFLSTATPCYADNSDHIYVVTANYLYIYQDCSFSSTKLQKVTNKTELEIEFDGDAPKIYADGENEFFKVLNYNNIDGYVFGELVTKKQSQIVATPNYNGKVSQDAKVFVKNDTEMVESEITLSKNTPIFMYEGYNKKAEYTAICFVYENQVIYGYIKTTTISANGINPLIITCFTVIMAVLGIVFAILFIKRKKSK